MRPFAPEGLIAFDPNLPELGELRVELSQPTFSLNQTGKVVIDRFVDYALARQMLG